MSIIQVDVKSGKTTSRNESAAEKKSREKAKTAAKKAKSFDEKRRDAYKEKEAAGDLPATIMDNIDEIWKALEGAELNGANLPPAASSIIRHRRAIKTKIKQKK